MARRNLGLPSMIPLRSGDTWAANASPAKGCPPSPGSVSVSWSTTCPNSWTNASKCIASSST
eukprot:4362843-Alexandrium_andersonii.AAC.1